MLPTPKFIFLPMIAYTVLKHTGTKSRYSNVKEEKQLSIGTICREHKLLKSFFTLHNHRKTEHFPLKLPIVSLIFLILVALT